MEEQKLQISVSNELLEAKAEHKDLLISHHDLELKVKNVEEQLDNKKQEVEEATKNQHLMMVEAENQQREKQTQQSVIDYMEASKAEVI